MYRYPIMPDIIIATNGIVKLLRYLETDMALDQYEIEPVVLKRQRIENAPVTKIIFGKIEYLQTGIGKTARVSPLFRKGDRSYQQTAGQFRWSVFCSRSWGIS